MFWNFILVVSVLKVASACTPCPSQTQKEAFEGADVVAHIIVTGRVVDSRRTHHIKYNEIFKPPHAPQDAAISLPNIVLIQPDNFGCDSIELKAGEQYLISGILEPKDVFIESCFGIPLSSNSSVAPGAISWSFIDEQTLEGLRKGFN